MRTKLIGYVAVLFVLTGGAFGSYHLARWLKVRAVIAADRAPFTILSRDFTYVDRIGPDLDFTRPHDSVTYLKARKTDGSIAEITFTAYAPPTSRVIGARKLYSIPDRQWGVGYGRSNVKSTMPLRDEELVALKSLPSDRTCVHHPERIGPVEFKGNDVFLGFAVAKHLTKSQTAMTELWEAPGLDCEIIYSKTVFFDGNGAIVAATIKSAVEVTRQEPEAWIFANAGGTELPPSRALSAEEDAAVRASGRPVVHSDFSTEKFRRQDDNYFKRRLERQPVP